MAEFQEVAKHWKRMCNKYWRSTTCSGCPIAENEKAYEACSGCDIDVGKMEELVMAWAAENPEPVYPTWWSWLINEGVIAKCSTYTEAIDQLKMHSIPADIARKLGIEPNGGIM